MAAATPNTATSFGFRDLMETLTVDVERAENRPLNVPLIAPFTIASSRLDKVENVAIRIELSNGCVGWGEAPILPFVTAEDQSTAMVKAGEACELLRSCPPMTLGSLLKKIGGVLPGHQFASVRSGVEMALIDAAANSIGIPLWRLFGGVSDSITTDITIPIVSPAEAAELASKYRKQRFKTLKLKVGKNLKADIEVLQAIRATYPDCFFILDANEGYKPKEAIEVLERLHADESCRGLADVKIIAERNLADVINIKLAKVGVLGALEIIEHEDEAYELLRKIAKNTHLWSSPRGPAPTQKRQAAGIYDLDPFNMINAKFDALTNVLAKKMEDLSMLVSSSSSAGSSQQWLIEETTSCE
ncbi:hypothetical protein GH714_024659 [Hevea brasiliensis]|uniref:Mandelate racemase/muconate lactonizing enzyme C-terminal domain-containing protein n=1 Tax=Hevea brasiliensis TaxID=3981 RepID=A0A6A6LB56_HEVBR|nr:hypothetical protein GH714_024659 [Hevea brasiliensis]